jgi:parvulin-like peptidyl-prolyl isomerase
MDRANRRLACAIGCGLALACACGRAGSGAGDRGGNSHGTSNVGGQVVSTVNGEPIALAEVDELVAAGLTPQEALERLQAERLLVAEARRRGVGDEWAVSEVERKAAVQALLSETASAVTVSDDELEAAFAKEHARFEQPERRACVHVLATVPKGASAEVADKARAVAEKLAPELEHAEDLDAFVHTYRKTVIDGVRVVVERLPAMPLHGRLVQSFADALFSLAQPGMVPGVVQTSFGWHAIRVTEIDPAIATSKEEAFVTLRKELLVQHQTARVQEFLRQLAAAHPVKLSDKAAQALGSLTF